MSAWGGTSKADWLQFPTLGAAGFGKALWITVSGRHGRASQVASTLYANKRYSACVQLDENELRTLIAQGEGRTIEFKQGLPRDEKTARSLCAFANTRGGSLIVGVTDKREAYGVPRPKEIMAKLREIASELLEPAIELQTTSLQLDDKNVVVAQVGSSRTKPHHVLRAGDEPEIVVRVGASNRVATGATLDSLRAAGHTSRPADPLDRRVLEWIAARGENADNPGGDATVARFSKAFNVGQQRSRRAFVRLERDGYLVAYGRGAARTYSLA